MKILMTGGAGFIGSHIADAYIAQGHKVIIVDDLSTGKKEFINQKAKFVHLDISDADKLETVFKKFGPFDIINHHAAQKSVTASTKNPTLDAKINILGTLNLLECAKRYNVKKFIFASTGGALYGDGVVLPTPEDAQIAPISPYGIAKFSVENYLRYYDLQGVKSIILRYGNVYGPRQDPHGEAGVVAIFCNNILRSQNIYIFGDGKQTRDFVYVSDVVRANLLASKSDRFGTYNVGTGNQTSVNDLAQTLIEISQKYSFGKAETIHADQRVGELQKSALNCDRIFSSLGWQPKTDLQKGLETTFASFYQSIK